MNSHVKDENLIPEFVDKLNRLPGKHDLGVEDLFPAAFIKAHTQLETISQLLDAAKIPKDADLSDLTIEQMTELDSRVSKLTNFQNWDELLSKAKDDWISKQI